MIFVCIGQKTKLRGVLEKRYSVGILKYNLMKRKFFFRMAMNRVTNYCEGVKYKNPDKFVNI